MKKILIVLGLMLICNTAVAGTISFTALSSDSGLSHTWLNDSFTTIYNDYNNNISSSNIADGSITSDDIVAGANPLIRDYNNIGEYVYSGLTVPTATGLSTTITAGIAFVAQDSTTALHRVVKGAEARTFTDAQDNYLYLDYAGGYTDSTSSTVPANSIVIAKVTTSGGNITAVEDLRQTEPPGLRVYTDYIAGMVLSRDSATANKLSIQRGEIELGSAYGKVRRNTVTTDITITATAGTYYYIFAQDDSDNATDWKLVSGTTTTAPTAGDRLIGWCYANASNTISPDSVGAYKGDGSSAPNIVKAIVRTDTVTTSTSYTELPGMNRRFYSSGRPVQVSFVAPVLSTGGNKIGFKIVIDNQDMMSTDVTTGGANDTMIGQMDWLGTLNPGQHTVSIQWFTTGNEARQLGLTDGPRVMIIEEK